MSTSWTRAVANENPSLVQSCQWRRRGGRLVARRLARAALADVRLLQERLDRLLVRRRVAVVERLLRQPLELARRLVLGPAPVWENPSRIHHILPIHLLMENPSQIFHHFPSFFPSFSITTQTQYRRRRWCHPPCRQRPWTSRGCSARVQTRAQACGPSGQRRCAAR